MNGTGAEWQVRCVCLTTLLLLSVACGSAMEDVSDSHLKEQANECARGGEMSPGMAIQCGNVEKECKLRRASGRYLC